MVVVYTCMKTMQIICHRTVPETAQGRINVEGAQGLK